MLVRKFKVGQKVRVNKNGETILGISSKEVFTIERFDSTKDDEGNAIVFVSPNHTRLPHKSLSTYWLDPIREIKHKHTLPSWW